MPTRIEPSRRRQGLTTREKELLDELAARKQISAYQTGQLRALVFFALDEADRARAQAVLDRHAKESK
jgi:hypothetical protein